LPDNGYPFSMQKELNLQSTLDKNHTILNSDNRSFGKYSGLTNIITWDGPAGVRVKNIANMGYLTVDGRVDSDGTRNRIIDVGFAYDKNIYSEEFQVLGKGFDRLRGGRGRG